MGMGQILYPSAGISTKYLTDLSYQKYFLLIQHPIYERTLTGGLGQIGVAVGLAWTSVGGEVMVVEATKMMKRGEKR